MIANVSKLFAPATLYLLTRQLNLLCRIIGNFGMLGLCKLRQLTDSQCYGTQYHTFWARSCTCIFWCRVCHDGEHCCALHSRDKIRITAGICHEPCMLDIKAASWCGQSFTGSVFWVLQLDLLQLYQTMYLPVIYKAERQLQLSC